jgi:glucose-6-phosphate dehydrogenase assembly protein OpcA
MAPDVARIERIARRPIGIEPAEIESAFDGIWQDVSDDQYDASSVRLRLLNLVAVGAGTGAEQIFDRVMEVMTQRYPCRGILASLDPDVSDVTAWISAHCWRVGTGRRHVCSEEVVLRGGTDHGRALASAVLALLVPEVPVEIWLVESCDLTGDLTEELMEAADRVFVDSARTGEPLKAYEDALAIRDDRGIVVSDFAWHRLEGWRAMVAQFFDNPGAQRQLATLQSIEIVGGAGRPSSEALLFAGWFVSRLGLSPADVTERVGGFSATLYDGTRGISLSASADREGVPLREVRLDTEGASFLIQLHSDSGHVHVREERPDSSARRTVAPYPTENADVMLHALDEASGASVEAEAMRSILSVLA